jgi:hypothetical protein
LGHLQPSAIARYAHLADDAQAVVGAIMSGNS